MLTIIKTSDGSDTLFVPELNEHYHSIYGAVQESLHIFIKNGLKTCNASPVRIFEVGFGTGLNALLSCIESISDARDYYYASIEKYPLPDSLTRSLNYGQFVNEKTRHLFSKLHSCKWDNEEKITENFTLKKINGDLITDSPEGAFDLIYFDAFGPDKQPEMWSDDVFRRISNITAENGILVTYSAKGEVKRVLTRNGFKVEMLQGPPGKRQIIRAVKVEK